MGSEDLKISLLYCICCWTRGGAENMRQGFARAHGSHVGSPRFCWAPGRSCCARVSTNQKRLVPKRDRSSMLHRDQGRSLRSLLDSRLLGSSKCILAWPEQNRLEVGEFKTLFAQPLMMGKWILHGKTWYTFKLCWQIARDALIMRESYVC